VERPPEGQLGIDRLSHLFEIRVGLLNRWSRSFCS
jgi:hypothetical protein